MLRTALNYFVSKQQSLSISFQKRVLKAVTRSRSLSGLRALWHLFIMHSASEQTCKKIGRTSTLVDQSRAKEQVHPLYRARHLLPSSSCKEDNSIIVYLFHCRAPGTNTVVVISYTAGKSAPLPFTLWWPRCVRWFLLGGSAKSTRKGPYNFQLLLEISGHDDDA